MKKEKKMMLMSPIPFWFLGKDYRSHSRLINDNMLELLVTL
jgi:hypothetical protein